MDGREWGWLADDGDQLGALAGRVPLILPPLSSRLSSRNFSMT